MHHSPSALCSTHTTQLAAVALPTADLVGRGGGWRLHRQRSHQQVSLMVVATSEHFCLLRRHKNKHPHNNTLKIYTQNDTTIKMVCGRTEIRKISGGLGFQEHGEVNMLWGGYIWHKFANLGILPLHNMQQSTQYKLPL